MQGLTLDPLYKNQTLNTILTWEKQGYCPFRTKGTAQELKTTGRGQDWEFQTTQYTIEDPVANGAPGAHVLTQQINFNVVYIQK